MLTERFCRILRRNSPRIYSWMSSLDAINCPGHPPTQARGGLRNRIPDHEPRVTLFAFCRGKALLVRDVELVVVVDDVGFR